MKKKEIYIWGGVVLIALAVIVGVVFAQDYGVPKPPTPVYTGPTNVTYDTGATANTVNNATPAVKPNVNLTDAENSLQQTICNAFGTTASSLPTGMLNITVLLPSDFDSQVANLGDSVTFGTITTNIMTTYKNNKYFQCLVHGNNCLLNFTANFGNGASEPGVINLSFAGDFVPYVPQNPASANYGVRFNPYYGMDPMPLLTRTSCTVTFQKPCPTKSGSVLCGQCDVNQAGTQYVSKPENLGQCFYCASNQSCTWGAGGLCSSYSCVNKTTSNTKKVTKYVTSCSNCQKSGYYRNYNYNGTNKGTCQNYLRVCRACGAADVRTNCK